MKIVVRFLNWLLCHHEGIQLSFLGGKDEGPGGLAWSTWRCDCGKIIIKPFMPKDVDIVFGPSDARKEKLPSKE